MDQFSTFGAKMRKSGPNMPKSTGFEDSKSLEKPEIHWTRTELSQFKLVQLQPPFTDY